MNNTLKPFKNMTRRESILIIVGVVFVVVAALIFLRIYNNSTEMSSKEVGIHKIQHVIVIFQENRSFDSYFGAYPGADGIPMKNGVSTVCVPDPVSGACVKPYVDHNDSNHGGPHDASASAVDINNGKLDGFIKEAERGKKDCRNVTSPNCSLSNSTDVMGYHTESDIPNYWAYARNFVLQDHMFESVHSWSFPSHLFLVSDWSADCTDPQNPLSCTSSLMPNDRSQKDLEPFGWTDLTYLLNKNGVSWAYYLDGGAGPLETVGKKTSNKQARPKNKTSQKARELNKKSGVPEIWNVLPGFVDVHQDNQISNVKNLNEYFVAAKDGTLPAVSWIVPNAKDSEHPPALVSDGQSYVTRIINAAMKSPDWPSTAIFLTWDDWGGFYDHVLPPQIDSLGYGIRTPCLVISPYAKKGYIDHQVLSFDAYSKFIEDDFMNGQRLNPKTDGRPDSRPDVRENSSILGNLLNDFDFNQSPRQPLILPVNPTTTLINK